MSPMPSHDSLLTPTRLGALTLRNRIVMSPMTRTRAEPGHVPGPLMVEHYAQRASAGLIITECTMVAPQASAFVNEPGIYDEAQVAGWRRVTEAVHAAGDALEAAGDAVEAAVQLGEGLGELVHQGLLGLELLVGLLGRPAAAGPGSGSSGRLPGSAPERPSGRPGTGPRHRSGAPPSGSGRRARSATSAAARRCNNARSTSPGRRP